MTYWILCGVLVLSKGHTTNISIPYPLLFTDELRCLKTKSLNESRMTNAYDKIDLECAKVNITK